MIGTCRALEIVLMTREAIFRRAREAAVDVTTCAIHGLMRAEQSKRSPTMIKARGFPRIIVVADLAIGRKVTRHMIGVCCSLKIVLMT